jgi:antitoxin ParD1/3/4
MARVIGFRPTPDDLRILEQQAWPGETMSDTLRRALRFMDREAWLEQARADARRLKDEDLGTDPDAW